MQLFFKQLVQLFFAVSLLAGGWAMAQSEPSMNQIYTAAQAGKLDEAQVMVQQVLIAHPQSAKAHFVQAELYSRQGRLDRAREALATAEKIAPGLPFAKPEAVQSLHAQLASKQVTRAEVKPMGGSVGSQAPAASSASWVLPLLLAGGAIGLGYFLFRRRAPELAPQQQPVYANQNGLSGPQTFGGGAMQPAYPQAGYPQGYPQQGGTGLGGRIMGGVATGLAVGAGVMAAEAIGRNLMGGHNAASPLSDTSNNNHFEPIATNTDMGGSNFGVSDTSWDDGGSADAGGGDWDN